MLMLLVAFALTAWFSYDYGRGQAGGTPEPLGDAPAAAVPTVEDSELQSRIDALADERDTLKRQVATLSQQVERGKQALADAEARINALRSETRAQAEQALPAALPVAAPEPSPAAAVDAPLDVPADTQLALDSLIVNAADSEDSYEVSFRVSHGGGPARVMGTIWIAVNGFIDGKPKRLSFKSLSPERRSYVKMGFEQYQDVSETLVLPDNFSPKNILIEAKPYGETFTGTSQKLDWPG